MTFFNYVQQLYSLDTLDTRLTASAKTLPPASKRYQLDDAQSLQSTETYKTANGKEAHAEKRLGEPSPSRWGSFEFGFYYLVFLLAVPLMFKSVYDVSIPSHPEYHKYEPLLSPGWIPGRKVDNSDAQYKGFRDNVPYMFIILALHPTIRRIYDKAFPLSTSSGSPSNRGYSSSRDNVADARLNRRIQFDVCFAIIYLTALHGFSAIKVWVILCINYGLAKFLDRRYVPLATWTFNIGILFANEVCHGYPYVQIADFILPGSALAQSNLQKSSTGNWGSFLDAYGGLIPRWEILFNITVLRLISFNFDYYWSLGRTVGSPVEVCVPSPRHNHPKLQESDTLKKKQLDYSNLSERDRIDNPAKIDDFSFRNYLAYILYSPLYLTGPILTFNDYISQCRYTPRSISTRRTVLYGIRLFIALLTMEFMLHFLYAVAISKAQPTWEAYTPFQLSMLGYFNLHVIWLKLLLPWRFFRLWALFDNIDPPENMLRCMSDNYSALAFWRGWHRSFNRWIVRYIYIPLGGSGGPATHGTWGKTRAVINMLAVFTFVALWHDIQLKLLIWGWLITLFVLPEVLAGYLFPKRNWQNHKDAYRVICGVGAIGNILMMMAANLVGFAVGLDGLKGLVHGLIGSYSGLLFLVAACGALFVGAQVMFELREHELRHGIKLKC
ncbi:MAG: hypothetical protein LQ342_006127 [Letrouitia transgressa]|nr:MAG: hypothetical protein LQ342_006127 [Letrouitia transgressa]